MQNVNLAFKTVMPLSLPSVAILSCFLVEWSCQALSSLSLIQWLPSLCNYDVNKYGKPKTHQLEFHQMRVNCVTTLLRDNIRNRYTRLSALKRVMLPVYFLKIQIFRTKQATSHTTETTNITYIDRCPS